MARKTPIAKMTAIEVHEALRRLELSWAALDYRCSLGSTKGTGRVRANFRHLRDRLNARLAAVTISDAAARICRCECGKPTVCGDA
jgi:hypothetical protein